MKSFAKRLKELRTEKGFTLRQMAEKLGINHSAYYLYEQNKAEPKQEMMVKIAQIFSVSMDYLYGLEDYHE